MNRVLSWDECFMSIAIITSKRSKDPSSQVGAVIVDEENKIVSVGYNGMPRNIDSNELTWNKNEGLDNKYLYVCHAEFNAILNIRNGSSLKGCTLYVTLFPCNECAKAIIQTGIKKVIYLSDKYKDHLEVKASKKLLDLANIEYEEYKGSVKGIELLNE
ncbi:MAG: deoxycytidylate deaminase [Bacillales bacterium]